MNNMKYKIWAVTYITESEEDNVKHSIKERVTKKVHNCKYLFETDDLDELRKQLTNEKKCDRIHFNYDL